MFPIKRMLTLGLLALGVAVVAAAGSGGQEAKPSAADSLGKLQKLIAPGAGEARWMQVNWMPSHDLYAARKKAAEEGKPLLLWYMAGEPLGTC